jgi:hypothetical protein
MLVSASRAAMEASHTALMARLPARGFNGPDGAKRFRKSPKKFPNAGSDVPMTLHAFGHMIEGDLRLERQGNTLIVHSNHNARWFGAVGASFGFIFLIIWTRMPDQGGLALLSY